jgi:hypothetical protein
MKTLVATVLAAIGLFTSNANADPYSTYNGNVPQWAQKAFTGPGH